MADKLTIPSVQKNDLLTWAQHHLTHQVEKTHDIVITPYSYVVRIDTKHERFYLKKTPAPLFIEANILKTIRDILPSAAIPTLIASDNIRCCFLMKACGDLSLRTFFDGEFESDHVIKAIKQCRSIQQATTNHINNFLNIGVSDWRFKNFPNLYNNLVDDIALLKSWDMSDADINGLQNLKDHVHELCSIIARYNLPDVLNPSDFQPNNILIDQDTKETTIIDWGEVTIGNPLQPIELCLCSIARTYNLSENSEAYVTLRHQMYKSWIPDTDRIDMIVEPMNKLGLIYYALTYKELIENTPDNLPNWNSKIKSALIQFIDKTSS